MTGKTVLVTGASQGIGRASAVALAKMGARVLIVCRDKTRGDKALADIRSQSGSSQVELLLGDFASLADIRRLAAEINAKEKRLDVLLNNAGAVNIHRTLTVDGYEATFAVNHLGYFLFTHLLLDLLKRSAPSRIVNVASSAHQRGRIDFDDLMREKAYSGFDAYGQSKLANILFTFELAEKLQGTGVTCNCVHPGVVATGFGQNQSSWLKYAIKNARPFFLSEESGAKTQVWLASSPEVEGVTGKYFARCREARTSRRALDVDVRKRLWQESLKLCGLPA